MAELDDLVMPILRQIQASVAGMRDDMHDLKVRMTAVEEGLAGVNRRLDRIDTRLDRAEVRLELSDEHLPRR